MIRVGLVDFDTSHVVAFTQRLNHVDSAPESWVDGATVVKGFVGDSAMMPERIPGFVAKLQEYGVPLTENLDDLLGGAIDAVMIESQQGSRHLERVWPFLEAGLPTFIDKPFAGDAPGADAILALAKAHDAPLMSCSALRYAPEVQEAVAKQAELGKILTADVWTSAALHDGNPGLLHYGIHGVEMLYTLMGPGCLEVRTLFHPAGEVVTGLWPDGRIGVVRGIREGQGGFGFAAHYEKGHHCAVVNGAAFYTEMLKRIVEMFVTRKPPIPYDEMREIMAFCDAALASRELDGVPVTLEGPE